MTTQLLPVTYLNVDCHSHSLAISCVVIYISTALISIHPLGIFLNSKILPSMWSQGASSHRQLRMRGQRSLL